MARKSYLSLLTLNTVALLFLGMGANAQELTVLWDRVGDGDSSYFGQGVDPLGDQNDDGFSDWAVFSLGRGPAGQPSERRMSFFYGGNPPETTPYLVFTRLPNTMNEPSGTLITGDLNGDGFADWFRMARYVASQESTDIDVFWGGSLSDGESDLHFRIPYQSTSIHPRWGGGFDFNGDEFDDLLVYLSVQNGDCTLVLLGGNPMDSLPDLVFKSFPSGSQSSLARSFGDINGDGFGDFETSPNTGVFTNIYHGSAEPDTIADQILNGVAAFTTAIVSDLNGDGRDDLINSAWPHINVYLGSDQISTNPSYQLNYPGSTGSQSFYTGAGDFNSDGYQDLIAVDESYPSLWGSLRLYLGHPWLNPDAAVSIIGHSTPLDLVGITSAAALGDINGDGIDDFAIGAAVDAVGGRRGRVVIISGDTSYHVGVERDVSEMPSEFKVSVYPNPVNSMATVELVLPHWSTNADIVLYNLLGQEVLRHSTPVFPGRNQISLALNALASGVYVLRSSSGVLQLSTKLVVLK